jgi:hypothetical protein
LPSHIQHWGRSQNASAEVDEAQARTKNATLSH